jgi:putative flippase GtrA
MTTVIFDPKERTRFLRFALVGVIGAVLDFGVSNLLIQVFNSPLVLAGTISFIIAILSNFYWNRRWTYPDSRSKPIPAQLVQFAIVSVVGLVIRIPVLVYLEPVMESFTYQFNIRIPGILDTQIFADNLTLAIAVIIVMFWNFFANRYWTYNDVQ